MKLDNILKNMLCQIEKAAREAAYAAAEVVAAERLRQLREKNAAIELAAKREAKRRECRHSGQISRGEHAANIWACRPIVRALRAAAAVSPTMFVGEVVHNSPNEFDVMKRLSSNGQAGAGLYFAIAPMASAAPSTKWGKHVYGAVVGRQVKDMSKTFHAAIRSVVGEDKDMDEVFHVLSQYRLLDFLEEVVLYHIEFGRMYVRYSDEMEVTRLI